MTGSIVTIGFICFVELLFWSAAALVNGKLSLIVF